MGRAPLRTCVAALALLATGGAAVLAACSGGTSSGGAPDGSTGSEASSGGAVDSSVPRDATAPEASIDAAGDASAPYDATDTDALDGGGPPPTPPFFDAGDCGVGPSGEPTTLDCTGLYSDWASKTVADASVMYDPGLHLWSDGAQKTRWLYLPPGTTIDTSDMDEWTFPVGTRIWKEFRLPLGDAGTVTRIETRLLWKTAPQTWYRTTYRWSDDGQSSAVELTTGELDAGGTGYEVPNQDECDGCHNGRLDGVLGFEAVALSTPGATPVTIETLAAQGLITAPPASPIVIPGDATQSAALAWLHTNCGISCHTLNGEANFTGFYMRLDVSTLASVETTNAYTTGWNVAAQYFEIPDAAMTYRIHACDVGSSCVYYRDGHRDGVDGTPSGTQMPPIDTHKVDSVDLASVAAWIDEDCDAGGDGG